jgi:hypothetical protein
MAKPPYDLTIKFHDVGCVVEAAGKTIAYVDPKQMVIDLSAYIENPVETISVLKSEHPGLACQPPGLGHMVFDGPFASDAAAT